MNNDYTSGEASVKSVSRNLEKERLQIATPALGVCSIFLIAMIVQVIISAIVLSVSPSLAENAWYQSVISTLPRYLVAMPCSLFFFRLAAAEPPERKKLSPLVLLGLFAISFSVSSVCGYLGKWVNILIGFLTGNMPVNDLVVLTGNSPLWSNLLLLGIVTPIMEEIFYRKLVIDRLRRYGDLPTILISGIGFGLLHGNFYQFFYAVLLGMLFGYIYLNTGKLRYTVALHMGVNLIGGVYVAEMNKYFDAVLFAQDPMGAWMQNTGGTLMYLLYMAFLGIMLVGALVAGILLFIFKRRPFKKSSQPLTRREWVSVFWLNPAIWIFLVMALLLFL